MRRVLACLWLILLPLAAAAQEAATLVADRLFIEADQRLVAEGNVEVFHEGQRMTAARVVYDQATDEIEITGPIRLTEGDGFVLLADAAELDRDLRNGLLHSARLVLDQQLQIASAELRRINGRYTRMSRAVASSCQVCASNPTPLWEIRARRVTHDRETGLLYFDNAQFRIAGVPVAYIPRLRMPDGTVERAAGFLKPELAITSQFGTGIRLPYFLPIGDSRDVTFTPYLGTGTTTLGLRYRQAFRRGSLTVQGAVSNDDLRDGLRGYLDIDGSFSLPDGYSLSISSMLVTDDAYLLDYGITSTDRLPNTVEVGRVRRDEYILGKATVYESLRSGDAAENVPAILGSAMWERRFGGWAGGQGGLRLEAAGIAYTGSATSVDERRDTLRFTGQFDWQQDALLRNGMRVTGRADLALDAYAINDDPTYPDMLLRALPALGAELRWPLARREAAGAVQILEPVAQMIWAPDGLTDAPNIDSTVLEFDEGNLFSFSRFPGSDQRELGARANLGLTWSRFDPAGWSARLGAGRVLRAEDLGQFTPASGLDGVQSDWLVAAQVDTGTGIELTNRALLGDDLGVVRDELRVDWRNSVVDLSASYIWISSDPSENRPEDSAEFFVDGGLDLGRNWTGAVEARYDFSAARMSDAGIGLTYRNECVDLGLSLSRRFTSSASVSANTEFAFNVALRGFGAGSAGPSRRRSCGL